MAILLKEREPRDYKYVITPTGRELPEMNDHWRKLENFLGVPLIRPDGPSLNELIIKQRALPNWRMRWCTRLVKIEPFMQWVKSMAPATTYIRADEVMGDSPREGTDWNGVDGVVQDFPLVRFGFGLNQVIKCVQDHNLIPPERTDCDICFFQRLIEWYLLWKNHPDKWAEGEAYEAFTGFTFRSDQRDSWPASMRDLRQEFEKGRIPKDTRREGRRAMCSWCAR